MEKDEELVSDPGPAMASPKINLGDLATEIPIRCPLCCNSTFETTESLRQHLTELQTKLSSIQCYACDAKLVDLPGYVEHLASCAGVTSPKKRHITTIECGAFQVCSPAKAPISGLKIIKIPARPDFMRPRKIITPVFVVGKDGLKKIHLTTDERKRPAPADNAQPNSKVLAIDGSALIDDDYFDDGVLNDDGPALTEISVPMDTSAISTDSLVNKENTNNSIEVDLEKIPNSTTNTCESNPNVDDAVDSEYGVSPSVAESCKEDSTPQDSRTDSTPGKILVYKCKYCDFRTERQEEQRRHSCNSSRCPHCDKVFINNAGSGPHLRRHRLEDLEKELNEKSAQDVSVTGTPCVRCKKSVSVSLIGLHHRIHAEGGGVYPCDSCSRIFVTQKLHQLHRKECSKQLPTSPEKFKCGYCLFVFGSFVQLSKHIREMHNGACKCPHCHLAFQNKATLDRHILLVHAAVDIVAEEQQQQQKLPLFKCHFCGLLGLSRKRMVLHLLRVHPEVEKKTGTSNEGTGAICEVCRVSVVDPDVHAKLHSSGLKVHACSDCPRGFVLETRLTKHAEQLHRNQLQYQCEDCPHSFARLSELLRHSTESKHSQQMVERLNVLRCRFCRKPHLHSQNLWRHERLHEARGDQPVVQSDVPLGLDYRSFAKAVRFGCQECDASFTSKASAESHAVRKGHMKGFEHLAPLSCGTCDRKFARKKELKEHVQRHLEVPPIDKLCCEVCGKTSTKLAAARKHRLTHEKFTCCYCDTAFQHQAEMLQHIRSTHPGKIDPFYCGFCFKYYDQAKAKQHCDSLEHLEGKMNLTVVVGGESYFCAVCEERVGAELQPFHVELHQRGVPKLFRCCACVKRFGSLLSLGEHTALEHREAAAELVFACPRCDLSHTSVRALQQHLQLHPDTARAQLKRFVCQYCRKGFKRSADRRKHELVHEGTKAHVCTVCQRAFRLANMLQLHMRTHTNERPYTCSADGCGATFKTHNALRNHKLSLHQETRPHQCRYCDKRFKTRTALYGHTGHHERLFKCHECGRNFPSRHAATKHIRTVHLDRTKQVFRCALCGAAYGRSLFLALHMKTHQPDDGHAPLEAPKKKTTRSRKKD